MKQEASAPVARLLEKPVAVLHVKPYGETSKAPASLEKVLHVKPYGETTTVEPLEPSSFREGFLLGILVGEGHFGGDGKQPQITLRMHIKHEALFQWIMREFPGGRLYGPYNHGGRRYYQWMARGDFLRTTLLPLLDRHLRPDLDGEAWVRYQAMLEKYGLQAGKAEEPKMPPEAGSGS